MRDNQCECNGGVCGAVNQVLLSLSLLPSYGPVACGKPRHVWLPTPADSTNHITNWEKTRRGQTWTNQRSLPVRGSGACEWVLPESDMGMPGTDLSQSVPWSHQGRVSPTHSRVHRNWLLHDRWQRHNGRSKGDSAEQR